MVKSSLAPKWSKHIPFCGMNHQKYNFLLISGTLSFGGCWGQPELPFWKLIDETQMSTPSKATEHQNATKLWFFYPSEPFSFVHFNMIHPVCQQSLVYNVIQIFKSYFFFFSDPFTVKEFLMNWFIISICFFHDLFFNFSCQNTVAGLLCVLDLCHFWGQTFNFSGLSEMSNFIM